MSPIGRFFLSLTLSLALILAGGAKTVMSAAHNGMIPAEALAEVDDPIVLAVLKLSTYCMPSGEGGSPVAPGNDCPLATFTGDMPLAIISSVQSVSHPSQNAFIPGADDAHVQWIDRVRTRGPPHTA